MTNDTTGWMTASGPAPTTSPLSTTPSTGASYTVGRGGMVAAGGVIKREYSGEYTVKPETDINTGYTFATRTGGPVPAGGPRMSDLVSIGGMQVEVGQAIRDGLMPDITRANYHPAQAGEQAPNGSPQGNPAQAAEQAPEGDYNAADDYAANVAPRLSPAANASILADVAEGQFSDTSINLIALEGGLNAEGMESVRSSYADKVSNATGLNEAELEALYNSDRQGFSAAIGEMLKNGSTVAFQQLAAQADAAADEAAYTPLSADDAANAWQSADFPQALMDANLEPSIDGGVVSVNIPGHGVVRWSEAVQRGLVKVSRSS